MPVRRILGERPVRNFVILVSLAVLVLYALAHIFAPSGAYEILRGMFGAAGIEIPAYKDIGP